MNANSIFESSTANPSTEKVKVESILVDVEKIEADLNDLRDNADSYNNSIVDRHLSTAHRLSSELRSELERVLNSGRL